MNERKDGDSNNDRLGRLETIILLIVVSLIVIVLCLEIGSQVQLSQLRDVQRRIAELGQRQR